MPNYDSEKAAIEAKTSRIHMLCFTMAFLGVLYFLHKANACDKVITSCNQHDTVPTVCKDQFFEYTGDSRDNEHTCTPGARAEVVTSPPAPKPGIMCHCINNDPGAASAPAQGK